MHISFDVILSRSMTAFINKLKIDYKYKKIHAFLILVPVSGEWSASRLGYFTPPTAPPRKEVVWNS